jgi:hypothetical protein
MKPTVYYIPPAQAAWGGRAWLVPVNHTNPIDGQCARNWHGAYTSPVVSWDEKTGRIETRNTVYLPLVTLDEKAEDKLPEAVPV